MIWLAALCAWADPLTLDTVLGSVDARVPALAAAEAKLEAAEAKLLGSRGVFDPKLAGKAKGYTGKDPRTSVDTYIETATILGPSVSVGWRRGEGSFPPYDGWDDTAPDGEVRVELDTPLLRDLAVNPGRVGLADARLGQQQAGASLEDKRILVRTKAELSWWKWVAAGAKRGVARTQLELAAQRNEALSREVEEGSKPRLQLLDNERVLYEREGELVLAERELDVAAQVLSLWYRDGEGRPIVPGAEALPQLVVATDQARDLAQDRAAALNRPDLRAARTVQERAELSAKLARNSMLPRLDGTVDVRQDLKDEPTELIVGAELELPLFLRKGRGERDRARAELQAAEAQVAGLQDQVGADVSALYAVREAAAERIRWAEQAASRAEEVLVLERRSWELGASDLFVVLQREEKLAKARKDVIDARLTWASADAELRAAIGER